MIPDSSRHVLRFGALDWNGKPAAAGYRMHALAEGASLGNAVSIERELASQLLDGSIARRTGYGNREATFDVEITADNSIALAEGAAALSRACENPTTLVFTPPDGLGAPTYFEVVTARADWQFNDVDELNLTRVYRVTIVCRPFGKSVESTTDKVYVVAAPAAEATVNACDSLTGFTGLLGSTASIDTSIKYLGTGSIKLTGQERVITRDEDEPPGYRTVRETGTVELTGLSLTTPATRPFISFKGYVGDSVDFSATMLVDGEELAEFVSAVRVNASWATFTFRTDATTTIESLRIALSLKGEFPLIPSGVKGLPATLGVPSTWAPRIDDILRNGAASPISRQSLRAVQIRGSARTEGSLAVSHPTLGLGKVLLLTSDALSMGFDPALMKHCTAPVAPTADTGSISGKVKAFSNTGVPVPFEFPASLIPHGGFQLIGFMETGNLEDDDSGAAISVTMTTKIGSVVLSTATHQQRITATENDVFEFVDCGPIVLPTTDVPPGSAATVLLEITPAPADALAAGEGFNVSTARFQEFYLIPLADDTTLNIFDCGTGTAVVGVANNRLWIDSADMVTRNPTAWMGTLENRSDAYHAASKAMRWQPLSLRPPEVLLYMANSGGAGAVADLTYTKAWQGLAVEE